MLYRRLGRSGMRVSEIALGSWLTYGNTVDRGTTKAIVQRAFELGVTFFDTANTYHGGAIWKSTDGGTTWTNATGTTKGSDSVAGYCGGQCFYDNVVKPDPTNPDIVYVLGSYGYNNSPQSGGVYRSTNGGSTWQNLGYDLHPDFHALAFQPSDPKHVVIGNDGGVWQRRTGGGRPAGTPLSSADWENLNGEVNPTTAALVRSTGLAIAQFTSVATVPKVAGQYWGGTQDNGTLRKSTLSPSWFDVASGDGGQVLVDPNNANFVFGTYFGISPYRYSNGGTSFFSNQSITNGINTADRAEFYIPWVMNKGNPNQLFLGTYRLYRTNNAETPSAGNVSWAPISPDLTGGCTGTAPNGARGCLLSAIGVADGGDAVYTGSDDGYVYLSQNAVTAASPTWKRMDKGALPARPVTQITVDRSNWRTAYAAYASFNGTTPTKPGHVFATTDGGKSWKNVSGNLPDAPVNSLVLDPSTPGTLYAGTDVGPFVTTDNGATWNALGSAIPRVAVWQLDLDSRNRVLAAGTHGRGAFRMDQGITKPALIEATSDSGVPVGPGSDLTYTLNLRNVGNAGATGVSISDLIPVNTSFVSASDGGTLKSGRAVWSGLAVPAGGSKSVTLTVRISPTLDPSVTEIVNDRITVTSAQGAGTTGSPHTTPIAPAHAVSLSPASQVDGARVGQSVDYQVTLHNLGYLADSYAMSVASTYPTEVRDAACTSPLATTATVASGGTAVVCVHVTVPAGASNEQSDTATVTATSTADATATSGATVKTIAVAADTLLVDNDDNGPNVQAYYQTALTSAGVAHSTWDLSTSNALPLNYMKAHKNIVWFTGNSYPGPITAYESRLAAFLDSGGRLFMSGQDILDHNGNPALIAIIAVLKLHLAAASCPRNPRTPEAVR